MSPVSSLHQALCTALDDEYRACATYKAVIDAFGPERPFPAVIKSERRHISVLLGLFAARGLPPIADGYEAGLPAPGSIEEACRIAIQSELENVALYDSLIALVDGDAEVAWVFRTLQRASSNCHLFAFRRRLAGPAPEDCALCGFHHGEGPCHKGKGTSAAE